MTRSDLIDRLTVRFRSLEPTDVEVAVKLMLGTMVETLTRGDRIEVRDFGTFTVKFRPPRIGRNPRTGEIVSVHGKHVPHFKAGKEMRERVDLPS